MVFQDPGASLNPSMTIRQTLREPLRLHDLAQRSEVEGRLQELMRLVQLEPLLLNRRPDQLSGGQKQRVGIARAIASNPSLVVLDEPTSSLDMSLRIALLDLLDSLQQRLGMTYLFITHDFSTVRHVADRVVVMYLGKVVESGPVDEILDDPKHPYTQHLVGSVLRADRRVSVEERRARPAEGVDYTTTGCRYAAKCEYRFAPCAGVRPALLSVGDVADHLAMCHLYDPKYAQERSAGERRAVSG